MEKIRILVVDDDEFMTATLVAFLTKEPRFEVDFTLSSKEALKMIYIKNYQIVIADLMMPEMDGFELVHSIKSYCGLIQVIAITGYNSTSKVLNLLRLGVADFFIKPFNYEDVTESIWQVVEKLDRWNKRLAQAVK